MFRALDVVTGALFTLMLIVYVVCYEISFTTKICKKLERIKSKVYSWFKSK